MSTMWQKLMNAPAPSVPSSHAFEAYYWIDQTGTSISQTAADLGTADSTRVIAVLIGFNLDVEETITGITIGGVTATIPVAQYSDGSFPVLLAYAAVPTGATGDIVITFSGSVSAWALTHVYALYNVTPAPRETGYKSSTTAFPSITFATGDIGLFIDYDGGARAWTNATEDFDDSTTSTASRNTSGTVTVSNDGEYQQYAVYGVWEQA